MKITDTTGRSMLVDLVYHDPKRGWLQAPVTQLRTTVGAKSVRGTINTRQPHGRYALRICSMTGADVLLFEGGEKRVQTSVGPRTQFVELDDNKNLLEFRPEGESTRTKATDVAGAGSLTSEDATSDGASADATPETDAVTVIGPTAPDGHGVVFAVVRFAKQNDPHGEPPQEEFELTFQMRTPEDHDEWFANNLHLVAPAEALPNELDPMSLHPATVKPDRPCFQCTFKHGPHSH